MLVACRVEGRCIRGRAGSPPSPNSSLQYRFIKTGSSARLRSKSPRTVEIPMCLTAKLADGPAVDPVSVGGQRQELGNSSLAAGKDQKQFAPFPSQLQLSCSGRILH